MFLAGTNFVLSYFAFKLKFSKIIRDEEFKAYSFLVIILTAIFAAVIYFKVDLSASSIVHPMVWGELEASVRHGLFQILAIVTTTGFVTSDYAIWTPILTISLFGLMFLFLHQLFSQIFLVQLERSRLSPLINKMFFQNFY